MADRRRLAELGMATELAREVAAQIEGAGGGTTWADISGKPAVIAAGSDAAAARTAIGAGTSNLTIGTTASTALAGNTVIPPAATWATLSGKPAVIAAGADAASARTAIGLGTAATQATGAFATAAQGALAATAVQPSGLSFAAISAITGDWRGEGSETLLAALTALQAAVNP